VCQIEKYFFGGIGKCVIRGLNGGFEGFYDFLRVGRNFLEKILGEDGGSAKNAFYAQELRGKRRDFSHEWHEKTRIREGLRYKREEKERIGGE
jgi:hypothetical protein